MGLGNCVTWMVFESRDTPARHTLLAGVSMDSINSQVGWGGVGSLGSLLAAGDSVGFLVLHFEGVCVGWGAFLFEPLVLLVGVIPINSFSLGSRLLSTHMQSTTLQVGQETLVSRSGIMSFLVIGKFVVVVLIVNFWLS